MSQLKCHRGAIMNSFPNIIIFKYYKIIMHENNFDVKFKVINFISESQYKNKNRKRIKSVYTKYCAEKK